MKIISPKALYYGLGKRNFFEYLMFAVFLIFFFFPLFNLVMLAFSDRYEVPAVFPQKIGVRWWGFVLRQDSLISSIATSFIVALLTTAVSLLICIPAAYALARYDFSGKRFFLFSFLLSNAFPKMGMYIAIAIVFYRLHLMGTLLGVVLIHIVNTMMFMTWIPCGAFRGIHHQQEESARDVGAGPFRTFLSVTFPLAAPGIIVASVFTFLASMEEAQGTLLIGFPEIRTVPVELYGVIMQYPTTAGPVLSILLMLPAIVVLVAARRYLNPDVISKGYNIK